MPSNLLEKMPGPNPGDIVACDPAQSKGIWAFETSHFAWHFLQEKMPGHDFGDIVLCEPAQLLTIHFHVVSNSNMGLILDPVLKDG